MSIMSFPLGKHAISLSFALGLVLAVFQIVCSMSFGKDDDRDDRINHVHPVLDSKAMPVPSLDDVTQRSTMLALPPLKWRRDYPSPLAGLIKLYVYEYLPNDLHVEDQLYRMYRNESYDNDWKAELALLQLFRSFPGRTWIPEDADLFVVPYLHAGHCLVQQAWSWGCRHVLGDVFAERLYANLTYYNETTKDRHVFLAVAGTDHTHDVVQRQPLVLTAGPRLPDAPPGHIIVPPFNDHPRFQPSRIIHHARRDPNDKNDDDDSWWWTRNRTYAFVVPYDEPTAAVWRDAFRGRSFQRFVRHDREEHVWGANHDNHNRNDDTTNHNDNPPTLGGLPVRFIHLPYDTRGGASHWKSRRDDMYNEYTDSVFCPVLANDMSWQRRFFDVILSGCLPVVVSWNTSLGTSWHGPESSLTPPSSIDMTFPFAKGLYSNDDDLAVVYESFVVQCPGNEANQVDVASLRRTMQDLLEHGPHEIRRRQLKMKEYAMAFTFGLGDDAHRYNDAFARIVRVLKVYVDKLNEISKVSVGSRSSKETSLKDISNQHNLNQSLQKPKPPIFDNFKATVLAYPPLQFPNESVADSPVKDLLKIYVYDDLIAPEFTTDVEAFMYEQYVNISVELNYKADLAFLQLFRSYPGRTQIPEEADLLFVPYAHASHCHILGMAKDCSGLKRKVGALFGALSYRNEYKRKHLYMTLQDEGHIHFRFKLEGLKLVTGPRSPTDNSTVIVVPTFNDLPIFQPSLVLARGDDWWTRPRKYAFSYFFAQRHYQDRLAKSPNSTRRFRTYFDQDMARHYGSVRTMAGMPFVYHQMKHGENDWPTVRKLAIDSYQDSVFCPVLAGDMAWQSRFFDAILSGCLPVVLAWKVPNGTSWFVPHYNRKPVASTIEESYPFAKGVFGGDEEIEVDYEGFVVQCQGNEQDERDVSSLRKMMLELLENRPDEIRRRQLNMKKAAVAFTFGMGGDAHRYNDAFARVVRGLKRAHDQGLF